MRLLRSLALVIAAALVLAGCGHPWETVALATPNPLLGQRTFGVSPVVFDPALVVGEKTEAGYLAEKDAETRDNWQGDKQGINEKYTATLIAEARDEGIQVVPATPGSAPFFVRAIVTSIEPGFYVGVASAPSRVRMRIQIITPDGRPLDEIIVEPTVGASLTNPSSGGRLRDCGETAGKWAAEYLKWRTSGG